MSRTGNLIHVFFGAGPRGNLIIELGALPVKRLESFQYSSASFIVCIIQTQIQDI